MTQRIPAEVFPPGEFIRDELEARGWTQGVLADVMGRPERVVSEIISGKRGITPETARGLSAAFGTDPTFWINLEGAYRLYKVQHSDDVVKRRSALYSYAPIKEMVRRGWIEVTESVDVLEQRVKEFFEVDSIDSSPAFYGAAKASPASASPIQLAWMFRVKQIARGMIAKRYSEKTLRDSLERLRGLMTAPEEIRHVSRILADCGVRYVLVESLAGSKIDGICFWLNDISPVIGMSLRHDRIDNFWFVLRHEIEHVLWKHGRSSPILDVELEGERAGTGPGVSEEEKLANEAAADFCVPKRQMDHFVSVKGPFFAERDIIGMARTLRVHPGIVAGQLQFRTNRYDRFRTHLVKIRSFATPGAAVDGWGDVAPTDS
jgi:HTH-type transcriptional regulator/antitoxin HigA